MAFIDELYKPDTRLPNDVVNFLYKADRAVKGAMMSNKASRRFQGYLYFYSEDYGDTRYLVHPEQHSAFKSKDIEQYGWNNVKRLLEKKLREEIGLRNFEVRIIPYTYEVKTLIGHGWFGQPKYRIETESAHKIWISASW